MTIRNRELNNRLTNLERCADMAPEGTFERSKEAAYAVSEAMRLVMDELRGNHFKAENCDRARDLEAAIYGYLLDSNPDESELLVAEGFGEHVDGPNGRHMIRQLTEERDALRMVLGGA